MPTEANTMSTSMSSPSLSTQPGSKGKPPAAKRRFHSGDLWMLLAVAAVLFLFLYPTDDGRLIDTLITTLYGPTAFVIIAVLLVQFLVLKARDRSRFYRLQLQMLTNKRREDLSLMRETRDALNGMQQELGALIERINEGTIPSQELRESLQKMRDDLEQVEVDIQRK